MFTATDGGIGVGAEEANGYFKRQNVSFITWLKVLLTPVVKVSKVLSKCVPSIGNTWNTIGIAAVKEE